jgi:DNA polymerase III alpha subunit
VAIIRPGAAAGGAKEAFIRRRRGEEPTEYLHPALRKLLDASHGVVIYEEDVMCIASAVTGMTLAEGDALRSAIKKCKSPEEMLQLENDLLRRAVHNGVAPDIARAIWQDLKKFAAYCFSKAHASGYGLLAYQSAYMKAHFPLELGCALLNNHAGLYSTRTIAAEVQRSGVTILHPSVNASSVRFTLDGRAIRTGLGRIKTLAADSIESILAARQAHGPFQSLGDFLRRVRIPRRETEALILAGAFDDLPARGQGTASLNHPQLLWELASTPGSRDGTCPSSPSLLPDTSMPIHPPLPPYEPMIRVRNELEILEMALTDAPLRLLRAEADRRGCLTTLAATLAPRRRVKVAGLLAASRSVRTRNGEMMRFLTLEDETGLLEATLFPGVHRQTASRLRGLGPYIFEGAIEEDHDSLSLNVAAVNRWDR